jgi:hypothetical protein
MAGLGTVAISLLLWPAKKAELGSIFLKSAVGEIVLESASILPQEVFMPGSFPQIVQSRVQVG